MNIYIYNIIYIYICIIYHIYIDPLNHVCAQPAGPEPRDQASGNAEVEARSIDTSDQGSGWVGVAQASKNLTQFIFIFKKTYKLQSSLEGQFENSFAHSTTGPWDIPIIYGCARVNEAYWKVVDYC